jgi:hypothetical protein
MKNLLLSAFFVLAVSGTAFAQCQPGGNGNGNGNAGGNGNGNSVQAQAQAPITLQTALTAIREARPALNAQLGQSNTISFYYNRYFSGLLTVEFLGTTEGADLYRVSLGGGSVIIGIDDEI